MRKYHYISLVFLALGLVLPVSLTLSNYLFALVILAILLNSKRKKSIHWLSILVISLPFLIPLVSLVVHHQAFEFSQLEVRLPFLITGIIIGVFELDGDKIKPFNLGLVLGSILLTVLFILNQINLIAVSPHVNWIDLSYAPLFITTSIIILWFTDVPIKQWIKVVLSIAFLLGLSYIGSFFFLLAGSLTIVGAIIVKGTRMQSRITIMLLVVIGALVLYKGEEIKNIIEERQQAEETPKNRLAQWQCVLDVVENKEFVGVGYGEKNHLLIHCYDDNDMERAEKNAFNAHNEYLDFFLTLGYVGIIALVIYFLQAMFTAYDNRLTALLLIMILLSLFALNENIFTRQKGVMLTAITYLMIYSKYSFTKKEGPSEDV